MEKNLDSIAIGVFFRDSVIIAIAIPKASFSITWRVASGVTSLFENPVPPVVKTKSTLTSSDQDIKIFFMSSISSATIFTSSIVALRGAFSARAFLR